MIAADTSSFTLGLLLILVVFASTHTELQLRRLHKRVDEIGEQLKTLEKLIIDSQERG
jgi:hypothetical protein